MRYFLSFACLSFLLVNSVGAYAGECPGSANDGKTLSVHMMEKKDGKTNLSYVQKRLPVKDNKVVYLLDGSSVTEERTTIDGLFDSQINIIVKESGKKTPWISYSYDDDTEGLLTKLSEKPVTITRIAHGAFGSEQKFTARLVKTDKLKLPIKNKGKDDGDCLVDVQVIEFAYHDDQNLVVRYHYAPDLKMVLKKEENYIKIYMGSMFSKKNKENTPTNSIRSADYIIAE